MVKTLGFCFCLFCQLFFFFKTAAMLNCYQLLLKGVNLVCGGKNHYPVVSIHLQCKKKKNTWEKLGSCISVEVFII